MTQGGQSRLANRRLAAPFNPFTKMALIVQKYGGTSVGDIDRIKTVANRIKKSRDEGHSLVIVVSARSGVTNELIAKAKAMSLCRADAKPSDLWATLARGARCRASAKALTMQSPMEIFADPSSRADSLSFPRKASSASRLQSASR